MKHVHKLQNLLLVVIACIALWPSSHAQSLTAEEVLAKFNETVNSLSSLQYTTTRIDTLSEVRQMSGEVVLVRDPLNQQFPFKLYGKDDGNIEFIFDGRQAINIYQNNKEFEFWTRSKPHYRTFVGLQGGQLLMHELLFPEKPFNPETGIGYNKLSVQELVNEYVLTLYYPKNDVFGIRTRVKKLTLDKKTWIPISSYHKIETVDGEKQVTIHHNTNIRINDPSIAFPVINTAALSGYREVNVRGRTLTPPTYAELLSTNFIDMHLKSINGSTAKLSEKKGKVILLAFWETWCSPCIESIPKIKQFVDKYSSEDFVVWGITSDEKTFEKVPTVVKRTGINYPVYYGTEKTKKDYRVTGVPEYVIIDQTGKIVFITAGFTDEIEKTLDALLK